MRQWPIKILHLGLGNFHRAHQAVYYQELFNKFANPWGVVAFSMRSARARDQLRAENHRYPVIEFEKEDAKIKWIESICETYFSLENCAELINYFCSVEIELVTLTITEKGYLLDSQGKLDTSQIKYDLENPDQPISAIGILFLGLKKRKEAIQKPLTVLSCDNLQKNGDKLKQVVLAYATLLNDEKTKKWIEQHVSFPNSMVDRIVPMLTADKIQSLQKRFSISNSLLLATESFSQWVIEDRFKSEKPPLEKVGVQFVDDVTTFEEIKLRLLNASHSLIAYSGIAKGYSYVHEAIHDPQILAEVLGLYNEVIPLLKVQSNLDLNCYTQLLIKRFDNPEVSHQLTQIAMDGSQKLAQRILPSLRTAYQNQSAYKNISAVIQYWVQYCYTCNPHDPLNKKIQELKQTSSDFNHFKKALWKEILADIPAIFP